MKFADQAQQQTQDSGDATYVNPKDQIGHLLLVWPIEYETDTFTKYPRQDGRPADAVYCDVVDLNLPDARGLRGHLMRRVKWTQGRLIRDTKGFVGSPDPLLVSMGKDGDAYIIIHQEQNPAAVALANQWEANNPGFVPGADAPVKTAPSTEDSWATAGGVWPPASGPPATAAARTPAETAVDRLRRQAQQANPYAPPGPTPPPAPEEFPLFTEEPPF